MNILQLGTIVTDTVSGTKGMLTHLYRYGKARRIYLSAKLD